MNIIEKLEALLQKPVYVEVQVTQAFQPAVLVADLRAIIEEYKSAKEPVAYADPKAFYNFKSHPEKLGKGWMWSKPDFGLVPMFTHPPLSDETVKDAARYRWLSDNAKNDAGKSMVMILNEKSKSNEEPLNCLDEVIDEAMKVDNVPK